MCNCRLPSHREILAHGHCMFDYHLSMFLTHQLVCLRSFLNLFRRHIIEDVHESVRSTELLDCLSSTIDDKVWNIISRYTFGYIQGSFYPISTPTASSNGKGIEPIWHSENVILIEFAADIQIYIDAKSTLLKIACYPPLFVDELKTIGQRSCVVERKIWLNYGGSITRQQFCRISPYAFKTIIINIKMNC